MLSFYFNERHGSEFKLFFKSLSRPVLPELRKRELTVPGKSGVYSFKSKAHEKRIVSGQIQYVGSNLSDLRVWARSIAQWLYTEDYARLIFDDEPDKYYMAKVYSEVPLESLYSLGSANIVFECQPYAQYVLGSADELTWDTLLNWNSEYLWTGSENYRLGVTSSPAPLTVNNPGTREIGIGSPQGSRFKVIITGSFTNFTVSMNGKSLSYNEPLAAETLEIDNINCTVKAGVNKLSVCSGDLDSFLTLKPGMNTMIFAGAGLNCSVIIDFIPQFI